MSNILLAFNSDCLDPLHGFFQCCADEARQMCADCGLLFTLKSGDEMNEASIMSSMDNHCLCVMAAHGSCDSIMNANGDDVISTRTTNYSFCGKGLYAISCNCAAMLLPKLIDIGVLFFVGYRDVFRISGEDVTFAQCALSGFRSFIEGKTLGQAYLDMLTSFDEAIKKAENSPNIWEKMFLLHDKEALEKYGNDDLKFTDLS